MCVSVTMCINLCILLNYCMLANILHWQAMCVEREFRMKYTVIRLSQGIKPCYAKHTFVFTDYKNNWSQKKLIVHNNNIYMSTAALNYRVGYIPLLQLAIPDVVIVSFQIQKLTTCFLRSANFAHFFINSNSCSRNANRNIIDIPQIFSGIRLTSTVVWPSFQQPSMKYGI